MEHYQSLASRAHPRACYMFRSGCSMSTWVWWGFINLRDTVPRRQHDGQMHRSHGVNHGSGGH